MAICEKCGKNIDENSKFCGYCGNPVSLQQTPASPVSQPSPSVAPQEPASPVSQPSPSVVKQEPVSPVSQPSPSVVKQEPVSPVLQPAPSVVKQEPASPVSQPAPSVAPQAPVSLVSQSESTNPQPQTDSLNDVSNFIAQPVGVEVNQGAEVQPTVESPKASVTSTPIDTGSDNSKKSGSGKSIVVALIVLVALGSIGYLVFNYVTSNNIFGSKSIKDLVKAVSNLSEKANKGATVTTTLEIKGEDSEQADMSFTLISKYVKAEDEYKFQMQLAKSLFSDEINLYAIANKEKVVAYVSSKLFDAFYSEKKDEEKWIKYEFMLSNIIDENTISNLSKKFDIDYNSIFDKRTVKYIKKSDGLYQYSLLINQVLVDRINNLYASIDDEEIKEFYDEISLEDLEGLSVDFYVNTNNVLSKVKVSYTGESVTSFGLSSIDITFAVSDLNNTVITIPDSVINSAIEYETYYKTYMEEYSNYNDYDDYDYSF